MKTDLKRILAIQSVSGKQEQMQAHIIAEVGKIKGCRVLKHNGNIYVRKGESTAYPCVVCHTDTVHDWCEDLYVMEFQGRFTGFNRVKMKQTGIGGDDKVGIYLAIEALKDFPVIKAAFFRDEETGCIGSSMAKVDWFDNVAYVLQADRRDNSDFITKAGDVELSSKEFQEAVAPCLKAWGYKTETGMMTDVQQLKRNKILASMANISCGYYRPHTPEEYIVWSDVLGCQWLMWDIIKALGEVQYPHAYVPTVYSNGYYDRWDSETNQWTTTHYPSRQLGFDTTRHIGKKSKNQLKKEAKKALKEAKRLLDKRRDKHIWDSKRKIWVPETAQGDPNMIVPTTEEIVSPPRIHSIPESRWMDSDGEGLQAIDPKRLCIDCYQREAKSHGLCAECFHFYMEQNERFKANQNN